MAGSVVTSTSRISDIFETMEYGTAPEDPSFAQAWLEKHGRSFGHFIDGIWVKPDGRKTYTTTNPANGEALACTLQGELDDVNQAVTAARKAFKCWSTLSCHVRARHLYNLARTIQKHQRLFSVIETLDNGKTIRETRDFDIPTVVRHVYHHAGWAELRDSEMNGWSPLGVVAAIVPWNFPLMLLIWKVCPALAMGNTVVLKPATLTRLSSLLFAEICAEAGLPPGVLNVVTGSGELGSLLAQHPDVDKVAFTGSTEVGRVLRRVTAGSGKALSLELGGKSPFIVFDSADLDSAVEGLVDAIWFNQGQVCSAGSVLLAQESIWEILIMRLKTRMFKLHLGSGIEKSVDMGPLVDETQKNTVENMVAEARVEGAQVYQIWEGLPSSGPYYPPTLITGLSTTSRCVMEEIFGPVLVALPFRTAKEAIALGNNTRYGLSASVWTENVSLAFEVASSLQAGTVWINAHNLFDAASGFGGVKESGYGRDGGKEGLFEFVRPTWAVRAKPMLQAEGNLEKFGSSCDKPPVPTGKNQEVSGTPSVDRSYKLYIGGVQCRPDSGYSRPVVSASDGSVLAYVPDGGRKDIRNAVESANKALSGWQKKGPHVRAQILYYLAENLEQRAAEFSHALSMQSSMPVEEAQKEVDLSVARLFHWAALCDKFGGTIQETPIHGFTLCCREPVGVIGIICPDEKPLLSFISLMGAAIARGNTTVMVPSGKNPLPALALYQVLDTSDLPGGVVNIVCGEVDQLTRHLTLHSNIQSVWYFGTEEGSRFVEWGSAENLKRTWVNNGVTRDWNSATQGCGEEFLLHATQCKNVWMPGGEIFAN
ncbi:aldehyde dehydrogenase family 16 member A1 [Erpetoichthys calabaricus]|uniref:aldehyde dehydrogenase family 16 member A1 n=1 Tax=Erpetoichthys calabaricus TaxID=27687 RepID=UPI002234BD1F|nr:aldehyde dehydrogenase family 16 member A1 [Erpetoichthys calabaricus]